jgi:hypothetical protein
MARSDWLALVAVHADTWLIAVAFYNGARLNREGRERLFELVNELPTCYEVVSGKAADVGDGGAGGRARGAAGGRPAKAARGPADADAAGAAATTYADGEGDPCPACARLYAVGEFWIACDYCDTWFCGACVAMTPGRAQRMGKWKCPKCVEGGGGGGGVGE